MTNTNRKESCGLETDRRGLRCLDEELVDEEGPPQGVQQESKRLK